MLERFERYPLTFGPTPIEKLRRLSEHLGGQVEIYAKREDCNSGLGPVFSLGIPKSAIE
jgi:1-aminocyclopropane-1-carboxylate deaminase